MSSFAAPRSERSELTAALAAVRTQLGVVALLLAAAGLAWWSTAERMAGMDDAPGTSLGTFGWFTGVWAVMMAAMMLPSLVPTAAVYATLTRRHQSGLTLLFAAGYTLVWSAAGVLAYALFVLGDRLFASDLAWRAGGHWLTAGVLTLGALYELTPLKDACLLRCRSPLRFLRGSWREGAAGAVLMGVRNAGWCVGCSWALMAALFALGVMSLTWMLVVSALVALEKVLPWRRAAVLATTTLLFALSASILVAPTGVPGLVVPSGSSQAMHSMHGMGGIGG